MIAGGQFLKMIVEFRVVVFHNSFFLFQGIVVYGLIPVHIRPMVDALAQQPILVHIRGNLEYVDVFVGALLSGVRFYP